MLFCSNLLIICSWMLNFMWQLHERTPVVCNEANLRSAISRQLVKLVDEGVAEGSKVASLQGGPRDVQQEQVDGRLGRPQHVLLRRDELNRRRLALRSSTRIAVTFAHGIVEELLWQLVDSVAEVATPPTLVDEMDEGVDVRAAGPAPDYRGALDDRQVGEVLEGVDEDAKRQPRLFQQRLRLWDLGEGRPEDLGTAVGIVPLLRLQPGLGRGDLLRGQDVPVL